MHRCINSFYFDVIEFKTDNYEKDINSNHYNIYAFYIFM